METKLLKNLRSMDFSQVLLEAENLLLKKSGTPKLHSAILQRCSEVYRKENTKDACRLFEVYSQYKPSSESFKETFNQLQEKLLPNLVEFRDCLSVLKTTSAYNTGSKEFYLAIHSKMLESFPEELHPKEVAVISNSFCDPLKQLPHTQSIYEPLEKKISSSEYLVFTMQGFLLAQKGSPSFVPKVCRIFKDNLDNYNPSELSHATHLFTLFNYRDIEFYKLLEEQQCKLGSFQDWVDGAQDLAGVGIYPELFLQQILNHLEESRDLMQLTVVEWVLLKFKKTPPEHFVQKRRELTFLSNFSELKEHLKLRYWISN